MTWSKWSQMKPIFQRGHMFFAFKLRYLERFYETLWGKSFSHEKELFAFKVPFLTTEEIYLFRFNKNGTNATSINLAFETKYSNIKICGRQALKKMKRCISKISVLEDFVSFVHWFLNLNGYLHKTSSHNAEDQWFTLMVPNDKLPG